MGVLKGVREYKSLERVRTYESTGVRGSTGVREEGRECRQERGSTGVREGVRECKCKYTPGTFAASVSPPRVMPVKNEAILRNSTIASRNRAKEDPPDRLPDIANKLSKLQIELRTPGRYSHDLM